jgi:hypothetical protein
LGIASFESKKRAPWKQAANSFAVHRVIANDPGLIKVFDTNGWPFRRLADLGKWFAKK